MYCPICFQQSLVPLQSSPQMAGWWSWAITTSDRRCRQYVTQGSVSGERSTRSSFPVVSDDLVNFSSRLRGWNNKNKILLLAFLTVLEIVPRTSTFSLLNRAETWKKHNSFSKPKTGNVPKTVFYFWSVARDRKSAGYVLIGEPVIRCTQQGLWSHSTPICE